MRGERFVGKKLSGLVLPNINLDGTNLAGTDLTKTVLSHSRLRRVDLSRSQCIETNFSDASLNSVIIQQTNFQGANFSRAQVEYGSSILGVAYHPIDNIIATDGTKSALALWDSNTGEELLSFRDHDWSNQCIQFSPQGNLVASGGMMGRLVVSDCANGKTIWSTKAQANAIRWLQFSANGFLLASVGEDLRLTIWNTSSWKQVTQVELSEPISCVAFSPDIEYIAAGMRNGEVRVWDTSTMAELWTFSVGDDHVDFVTFSPDSKKLIAGGHNSRSVRAARRIHTRIPTGSFTVKVCNIGNKRQELEINTKSGAGWNRGTISPTEPLVTIRSEQNSIGIWNYLTGEQLRQLKGHDDTVFCMVFNSDGSHLASSSGDGTVRIWNMRTGESELCIVFDIICTGAVFKDCIGLHPKSIHPLRIRGAAVEEEHS